MKAQQLEEMRISGRSLTAALAIATFTLAACDSSPAAETALCERVEAIGEAYDDMVTTLGADPRPAEVAPEYRTLAARYEETAEALADERAAERTSETASLFAEVADELERVEDTSTPGGDPDAAAPGALEELQNRMEEDRPLGLSARAWSEIDDPCDIPRDERTI